MKKNKDIFVIIFIILMLIIYRIIRADLAHDGGGEWVLHLYFTGFFAIFIVRILVAVMLYKRTLKDAVPFKQRICWGLLTLLDPALGIGVYVLKHYFKDQ